MDRPTEKVKAVDIKVGDTIVIDIGYGAHSYDAPVKVTSVYESDGLFGGKKVNIDWAYGREVGTTDGSPETLFVVER